MAIRGTAPLFRNKPAVFLAASAITAFTAYNLHRKTHFLSPASAETPPKPLQTFNQRIGFTSLRLLSTESVNHNTKRLRFALPEGPDATSGLTPTSSLLSFTLPNGAWFPTLRPYTPVSSLDEKGHVEFLIKLYPGGKASGVFHGLELGESVTFFNKAISGYKYVPNEHKRVLLIAGGAGITPCFQMVRAILEGVVKGDESDATKATLVWGVNTSSDLFLKGELDALVRANPERLRVVYTVSDGKIDAELEHAGVRRGRVEVGLLKEALKEADGDVAKPKVFLCGPPAMEKAVAGGGRGVDGGVLGDLGFGTGDVVKF